jgi:hypothetical protein
LSSNEPNSAIRLQVSPLFTPGFSSKHGWGSSLRGGDAGPSAAQARQASGHAQLPPCRRVESGRSASLRGMQAKQEERLGNGSEDALRRRGRGTLGGFRSVGEQSREGVDWRRRRGSIMYNSGCMGRAFAVRY